jgi:paraquat-inducible protein A
LARKADSLSRTWALLAASAILYVPANLLPVMHSSFLVGQHNDTILSGIVALWTTGSKGLAVIVFVASITVPLLKMASLSFLAISVGRWSRYRPRQRAALFRLVDFVGRWSMLDVFVVTLMVGLVQFGAFADIEAGPGAAAFAAVVLLTMLAAKSFDPRLIWDRAFGSP